MAKKKKLQAGWKLIIGLLTATALLLIGIRVYEYYLERRASFVRYDAFGIEVPVNYAVHGIDVSKYQQLINWESVSSMQVEGIRLDFAFIKATEGNKNVDRYFKRNWNKSRTSGVKRGAYHFFLSTKSGKTQAENFIRTVDLEPGDLPPVLDVEQTYGVGNTVLQSRVKEWLVTVENHYGVRPIIYTNVDFYKRHLGDAFDEYPLWVAHYLQKRKPRIHRDWHFWQYSELGKVNGISSNVDFNVFNGDSTEFNNLLLK